MNGELKHYGVLGMKWGVRRYQPYPKGEGHKGQYLGERNTKRKNNKGQNITFHNGEKLQITRDPSSLVSKFLAKVNPDIKDEQRKNTFLTLSDKDGKKVGEMQLYQETPTSLNIVWVSVKSKSRGHGYGTTAVSSAIEYAKKNKLKTVTLEVPGHSPDAKHIYEKLGFKEVKRITEDTDDIWGGLTAMKLNL